MAIPDERRALLARLATYVPFHAVEQAVAGESPSPGTQRLEGSVLVADLSGFTALSEALARKGRDGIDELTGILNRVFSKLLESAVFPYDGYLVKFAGDALLAFYCGEGHAARACSTALAAQREMDAVAAGVGRALAIRVGIGSGSYEIVTVGARDGRLDCFCAGEAALRALDASDRAGPGEIVLDGPGLPPGPFRATSDLLGRLDVRPPSPAPIRNPIAALPAEQIEPVIERLRGFVAPESLQRIEQSLSSEAVPAERRHACAVFCEIEGWDGDIDRLCEHYAVASDAAARHGGAINKIDATASGPRLLATFGIPAAHGDDERRAVAFALELRYRLRATLRIGLESGPLFAGEAGSVLKRELTVLGDTVNVAARLAHAARPGQVLCGPAGWMRVDSFVGKLGAPLPLKGKSIPVSPFEVVAPRRFTATCLQRRLRRAQLLGRERELETLDCFARRAQRGEAIAIDVVGPPGIGKSALLGTFADRWLDSGGIAFSVCCAYDKRDQPYLLFRALLSAWLDLPIDAPRPRLQEALARSALMKEEGLAEAMLAFLDPAQGPIDSGTARLLAAGLVKHAARERPLLVIVEDASHADAASAELLEHALRSNRFARLLTLTTFRSFSEEPPAPRRKSRPVLQLMPLERPAVGALLARALEVAEVDELLLDSVEARAHGNPLFVSRLASWLLDRGLVERVADRALLSLKATEDPAHALPPDLESLVNAEADQLPPLVREVLRTVSVLGAELTTELAISLCEAGGIARQPAAESLQLLARTGMLMTTGGASPTLRFTRLTDREVIYAGLPADDRRRLHAQAARVLVQRSAATDRLAAHYDAADDHPNAARCCLEVARGAFRRGAYADALRLFRAASRHLEALGQERTECQLSEVECLARLSSYGEARALALELSERLADPVSRIRALTSAAMCASYEGDVAATQALVRKAREGIPPEAPADLRAGLLLTCASFHNMVGQPLEALEELAEASRLAGGEPSPITLALSAGLLAETGRLAEALPLARQALARAESLQHRGHQAFATISLGRALELSGDPTQARERYLEARRVYAELGQPANAANALLHAAQADLELDDPRSALEQLLPALEIFRHYQSGQDETAALCSVGRARWLLGDQAEARRNLEEAVARSAQTLEHHAAIAGRAYLAEALWSEDRSRAGQLLDTALRLGAERGMAAELAEARRVEKRLRAG